MTAADLPTLNAALNATATILLLVAWRQIKARRIEAHRRTILLAFATSVAFLMSYIVYHAQIGSRPYSGPESLRTLYYTILIPHVILAAAVVPMILLSLRRGLRREDVRHRAIAKWTMPIWLFVSVTGVIVYVMLYWLPSA